MPNVTMIAVTSLLFAGSSVMAGDVLQVDAVESEVSGFFKQSCGNGGGSFSQSANDFAQFPISIDESVDCDVIGSLEASTDGSVSDNSFELTARTYAGGNEGFGEYVLAYCSNNTVVSFTILRDAHVRFETCKTGYDSDYYDMGSTSSYGTAVLTNTATDEVVMQTWSSSSLNGTICGLSEQMLEAGSYALTFDFDAGSSCNCGSSSEIQISLEARPVPSMTIFDGIGVNIQQALTGEFPAEAETYNESEITDVYEDLPTVFAHSFVGAEKGSCTSVDSERNRCSTRTWGMANGNVILLKSEATAKTVGDSNAGLCYLDWQSDIFYDFNFELLRACTVTLDRCHDSAQHPFAGEDATDTDGGFTEVRLWDPDTKDSIFYSYLLDDGVQCDTVEIELQPGTYRMWADSHAWSTGRRGHTTIAQLEVTFYDKADLNQDGRVNGADIAVLLGSWGVCVGCPADITGDGVVSGADLSQVLGGWAP